MRPHVCIPSGCQQWVSKTIAVGVDKFAYMSSLAIYVYSSVSYLPLAILAKHEERLSALAMSPFDANLLACAVNNQELRVYDVDTELLVCKTKYSAPKAKVSILEWHRTHPGVLIMAIGSSIVAWDFAVAAEGGPQGTHGSHMNGGGGGGAAVHGRGHANGSADSGAAPPPPPPPPPPSPPPSAPRSMLMRFRNPRGGGSGVGGGGDGAADGAVAGRWVVLRDLGSPVMSFDQGGGGGGAGGATGSTLLAVATSDSRIIILELDPSGLVLRGELRSITLPDAAAAPSVLGLGGGSAAAAGLAGIGPASSVCWEPLSANGLLLIVGRAGVMALYDVKNGEFVLSYGKQPATATRFAQFIPWQPGNFLLSSSRSGALQLWNVSQPQPLRLIKPGGGLVQCFALLRTPAGEHPGGGGGDGGSGAAAAASRPTAVLVSFSDGAVFSYDMRSQQVVWRQEGGHTETVFDCRFCTTDPNLLATASFDSTVRVWDVRTARCVKHLLGGEGILYSVSWSSDGKLLAASNDSGVIFLYDYGRGAMIKAMKQHTKQALKVAFHPVKPTLLASASVDGTVFVYTVDGEVVRTLRHGSPVSGIGWSSLAPGLLATTSEEGELHVWDVSRPPLECLVRTLIKHSQRAFNVEFSPLLRNYLLSSSNDRTARVWDVSSGDCLAVLAGHSAEVRAIAWHPEVAHICFTGSWDASVRVWDVRTGHCIHVANDHHADVYGIACHPRRPFFLVTCSRDTTLRLWSTLDLTPSLMPQALVRSLTALRGAPEEAIGLPLSASHLMCGPGSLELADRLAAPACTPLERFAALAEFFLPPACMDIFWDVARYVRFGGHMPGGGCASAAGAGHLSVRQRATGAAAGGPDGGAGGDDGTSLHHWTAARMAVGSAANHLELAASSKTRLGSGTVRREELLREAAQQHLLAGNVEHCCELLAEVGDWDRALALAPVAGLGFWQSLLRQRVQALAEAESQGHVSEVLPLYLVSGQVPELVEMLSSACLYDTAFNVAAVQASGGYPGLTGGGGGNANANGSPSVCGVSGGGNGIVHGGSSGCGARRSSGGGRERCNSAGSVNGVESLPPLRPPSPNVAAATAAAVAAAASLGGLASPSGLERARSSSVELSGLGTTTFPGAAGGAATTAGNGAGGSLSGGAQLTSAGPSLPSSTSSLPPLVVRNGVLPGLSRLPSLRPPPLAPILTSSGSTLPLPSPQVQGGLSAAQSPAAAAAAQPSPLPFSALSGLPLGSRPDSPPTYNTACSGALGEVGGGGGGGSSPLPPQPSSPPRSAGPAPPSPLAPTPPSGLRTASSLSARHSRGSAAAAAAAATGGGGSGCPDAASSGGGGAAAAVAAAAATGVSVGRATREAFERAVSVRCAQARGFLSQGLPLQAACCALTVDDVAGAVGLLMRAGQEDMALALVQGLSRPIAALQRSEGTGDGSGGSNGQGMYGVGLEVEAAAAAAGPGSAAAAAADDTAAGVEAAAAVLRPRVLVAAAYRREAAGDYLTAAELLKQVPYRSDLRDLLAGRCRAHSDPSMTARVFRNLGLLEPGHYAAAAEAPGALAADAAAGWEGVRRLLVAGQQPAAADRALAGLRRLVEAGERVSVLSAEWEQAWGAINSLCASALGPPLWSRVFSHAAYVGALLALEQGCAAVGLYLVRVLEAWVAKQPSAELPVPQSRLAAEVSEALDDCLALPAYGALGGRREALLELVLAPPGSPWMQGMLQSRLAQVETRLPSGIASPMSPPTRGVLSPPHHPPGAGGGVSGSDSVTSPSAASSSHLNRRLGGLGGSVAGSSLRLGSLELGGATSGRFAVGGGGGGGGGGGVLAAALSALQPTAAVDGGGGGRRRSGGGGAASSPVDLARGPVVVAAAHVPTRSSSSMVASGALPTSAVSGVAVRGAAVLLDDGVTWLSLSEAVALRRVMSYSPVGSGRLLLVQ